jgi:hypothetical protein
MRYAIIIFLFFTLAGCASTPEYDPLHAAIQIPLPLNENAFKEVKEGMTLDQVHKIMGQELKVGFAIQLENSKPLTIANPYKIESLKGSGYVIEYYVENLLRPDSVLSDDELQPLVFRDGKLIGRGWPLLKSLSNSGHEGTKTAT